MNISINANKIKLFENINKTKKIFESNNNLNEKTDKNKTSITLKDNNKQSSLMENFLEQKQSLIEQRQALMEKEMDPEERKYKLEDINKKMQEIEAQIQQLNIQEKQEEVEKQEDEALKKKLKEEKYNQDGDEVRDDIIISASLSELIKFNSSKETMHLLKDSKNRQIVESQYIKPNDDSNSYNNRRLSQISKSIATIDMTISKKIGDLNKSAERINTKTKLAIEQIKREEDKNSDEEKKTNEDDKKIEKLNEN